LLTFQIMNHSICLTGWKAKYTAPLMILLYTWVVTFCQRFAYFPDYEPLHLPYWMES
jgi:branched-subunit amino acid transport protein